MSIAKIHVDYEAYLTIVQDGIVEKINTKYHPGWTMIRKEDSPFKDWGEPMNCWYAEPSCIYFGVFSDESFDKRKKDTVFLRVYSNIPMWNMEKEIKSLIHDIGVSKASLVLPDYVRAVAQGALRLLEFSE